MKRITVILTLGLVLSLIMGLTQCKKKDKVEPQSYITFKIDYVYSIDGKKIKYEWKRGDRLWTISDGHIVGALLYNDADDKKLFNGVIGPGNILQTQAPYAPVEGKPLNFVFTGNIFPNDMKIDISNQRNDLAFLFCGTSKEKYCDTTYEYTGSLENKFTTVKFTMDQSSSNDVRVFDMITKAELYEDNGIIRVRTDESSIGYILTNNPDSTNDDVRYAALLPQNAVQNADFVDGNRYYHAEGDGGVCVDSTFNKAYLRASINRVGTMPTPIEPYFSVSKTKIVNMAHGNLQYKAAGDGVGYRFAEEQWHYVGGTDGDKTWGNVSEGDVLCSNNNIASDYEGWIDLFGWGTGNAPAKHGTINADYENYTEWGHRFDDRQWYTLSKDEWNYLLNNDGKNTVRKGKNVPATVHGVGGILILPDCFELNVAIHQEANYHHNMNDYGLNVFDNTTTPKWAAMEEAGAMFLPAAGWRNDTVYKQETTNDKGLYKMYWSKSFESDSSACYVYGSDTEKIDVFERCRGCAVRLVRDVTWPY